MRFARLRRDARRADYFVPRYTAVLRYFKPESAISVTTFAFGPNRFPISIAAITFAPDEVPANNASSRAMRLVICIASAVFTGTISSTRDPSHNGGV